MDRLSTMYSASPGQAAFTVLLMATVDIPLFYLAGMVFFGSWDAFWSCVRFWLTPDILSMFRGEFVDDWWAEFKLWLWFSSCAGLVWLELALLDAYLPA